MSKFTSFQPDSQVNNHNYKTAEFTSEYHILSLSGGKDSTALAFFMKENMPEIFEKLELVFYDTGCDLPETYDYLNKIEIFLKKEIIRVQPEKTFEHLLTVNRVLPSHFRRWCTVELKVRPSQKYIEEKFKKEGKGVVNLYVGIRKDEEHRKGILLLSDIEKEFVKPQYPLIDNFICKNDVEKILVEQGIDYPSYYNYRSRNGCYFCFYQKPIDWLNLYEKHPDLFKKASEYEQFTRKGINRCFRWNEKYYLEDMIKPENMRKIPNNYKKINSKNIIEKQKLIEKL